MHRPQSAPRPCLRFCRQSLLPQDAAALAQFIDRRSCNLLPHRSFDEFGDEEVAEQNPWAEEEELGEGLEQQQQELAGGGSRLRRCLCCAASLRSEHCGE